MSGRANRKLPLDAAESEAHRMRGNSMRGNRETPESPTADGAAGRPEKAEGRASGMYDCGESDDLIVPGKRANKAGQPAAEPVEGSGSAKGNALHPTAQRTQSRASASSGLHRVRQAARRDKGVRFTALLHHVTPELLRASFYALNRRACPGVDGMTWREYERALADRLADLHGRVHRGSYRAKPSRRAWIPKADGRRRPLGIAALEDKIVQQAVRTVLDEIYEEDFLGFSYGFRPGRGPHDALDALWVALMRRKVNWVLDADIRGFFDTIDHECLLRFLEHRIGDRRVLRLIRKWLRAGVLDEGRWTKTTVGTPQGSVISPQLGNVYLHYVLDLWAEWWRGRHARGDVVIVRYADDFVMGFQYPDDARRCLTALRERMGKFGLELHPEKTRLLEFGRFAAERRQRRGQGRPETFDFLGFTHICEEDKKGRFSVRRQTMAHRMRATVEAIKAQLRRRMHQPIREVGRWLGTVMRGWMNYHAVPGNRERLWQFRTAVTRHWRHVLRRRSQKAAKKWTWARLTREFKRWLPRLVIVHPDPGERFDRSHPR